MAIYQLYSHCITCKYKNSVFSSAFVFVIFCLLLAIVPPFLIIERTEGFWMKTETKREKPTVHFKHEFLMILETNEYDLPTVCGTISSSQFTSTDKSACSVTKVLEEDINKDGKNDCLNIEIEVPLQQNEMIHHVKLFLLFDYRLSQVSHYYMETMGFVEKSASCVGGSRLDIFGDLRLQLRDPITPYAVDTQYNTSIFKLDDEMVDINSILRKYSERNTSTHIFPINAVWTFGRAPMDPFILTATINYPEEHVTFHTYVFNGLQWAWIQYFALLWPFLYISQTLCTWAFKRGIITAGVILDPPLSRNFQKKIH